MDKEETKMKVKEKNISILFCLIAAAVFAAGCGPSKQDHSNAADSDPERVESDFESVETEKNENSRESAKTGSTKNGAGSSEAEKDEDGREPAETGSTKNGADSSETEKNESSAGSVKTEKDENNLDSAQTSGGQDKIVFTSGQADSISVDITAANAIVAEAGSNLVLFQKNSTAQIAPASTAKMIMALTALDFCAAEDQVTVGAEIEMMPDDSSRAWLNQGDTLTVRQLLIALLLPSGNDAAYSLAVYTGRKIAGDDSLSDGRAVEVFMEAVNKKAGDIGAEHSNFVVPDGYDAQGQYTTAYDLAVIAAACLDNPQLAEIMAKEKSYEKWTGGREVTYYNSNKLLDSGSPFYYPEVIGFKTGTSSLAGASLVSAAVINEKTYISVVMGAATEDDRFQDSIIIYDAVKALMK